MKIFNERGFMLLSAIFLTMIAGFAGLIVMNGTKKISNYNSTLRIIAINIANEQFAEIESRIMRGSIITGSQSFLGVEEDLKTYSENEDEKIELTEFEVITNVSSVGENLYKAKVRVEWNFNNENDYVEFEKIIRNFKE